MRRNLGILMAATAVAAVFVPTVDAGRPSATPEAPPRQEATFVAPVAAQPTYKVTMVARVCPTYQDIYANRARNDIMESLRDLGPNTPYNPFINIDPAVEDSPSGAQARCQPLPDWTFSFGTGIRRPVPGTNLSYVTGTANVANRQIVTSASTPLLDTLGRPTGRTIAGATTFDLTAAELNLASRNSAFWVMGGTTTEPLNGRGDEFGFGALRCARDNLNGDNVEWIGYPQGQTHVFCYAFYVKPPPEAGIINIIKRFGGGASYPEALTFRFGGNLSFNTGGAFSITVPANGTTNRQQFVRGAVADPWVVFEEQRDGWILESLSCASASGSPGGSTVTYQQQGGSPVNNQASIVLAAGDTVDCVYTNVPEPPPAAEGKLIKYFEGPPTGIPVGLLPTTWSWEVFPPGATTPTLVTAPVDPEKGTAESSVSQLNTFGDWLVREIIPPETDTVRWEFAGAYCVTFGPPPAGGAGVVAVDGGGAPEITVPVGTGERGSCSFINDFTPKSKLTIRTTSIGGTGTFGYKVSGADTLTKPGTVQSIGGSNQGVVLRQESITTQQNAATVALPNTPDDSTNPLVGQWLITPISPTATSAGRWVLDGLPSCNFRGAPALNLGPEELLVNVGGVAADLVCDYVYRLIPPSTLDLAKVIAGDPTGQQGTVAITANCNDGSSARLEVPPGGGPSAQLPSVLSFLYPVTCQVAEVSNGGGGSPVSTTVVVTANGQTVSRDPAALTIGSETTREDVVVRYTNVFSPGPQPPPPTTVPPTIPPVGSAPTTGPLTLLAILTLCAGVVLLVVRRRATSRPTT